jgi:hypothetical protein
VRVAADTIPPQPLAFDSLELPPPNDANTAPPRVSRQMAWILIGCSALLSGGIGLASWFIVSSFLPRDCLSLADCTSLHENNKYTCTVPVDGFEHFGTPPLANIHTNKYSTTFAVPINWLAACEAESSSTRSIIEEFHTTSETYVDDYLKNLTSTIRSIVLPYGLADNVTDFDSIDLDNFEATWESANSTTLAQSSLSKKFSFACFANTTCFYLREHPF